MSDLPSSSSSPGNLDAFIVKRKPDPEPIAVSQEIRDRGSIFVGHIYSANTPEQAKARITHVKHIVHRSRRATHEIGAWRCMVLKPGRTGLDGIDDFELVQGSKDDGESWAGGKILKVMQTYSIIDAVIIVSRWYGGTLLGPARFSHIETCAADVCRDFEKSEELREYIATLQSLDEMLAGLRKELNDSATADSKDDESSKETNGGGKRPVYKNLDIERASRLIQARERSIKSVQAMLAKKSG